ncbi:MAG TPA: alpha/beta fold hydrolase [Verrucomicrobiae bacterium]|nr:alpha/beta fold hydrolase [Verrucomicrobiae bacterium]
MARLIQSPVIPGVVDTLLEEPDPGPARLAAVVCHPHPLHGGTMHNKVVHRMARALRHKGAVVLRFNFRKVGEVEAGVEDARAALAWLRERYPDLPWALAGFSFGARVATTLACEEPGAQFVMAAGFPTRWGPPAHLETCAVRKIFLQSTHDQYGPRVEFEQMYGGFAEPKQLRWIESADHFFASGLDKFEAAAGEVIEPAGESRYKPC